MKQCLPIIAVVLLSIAGTNPVVAQPKSAPNATSKFRPVTIEYYYRIKWGQKGEFLDLYRKNHEPPLLEMQKAGFIISMKMDEPFTHMAGGPRWDLRVTISYRDGTTAVGDEPGGYDEVSDAIKKRLYPDKIAHAAAEAKRMGLLEEHWDVIVYPIE